MRLARAVFASASMTSHVLDCVGPLISIFFRARDILNNQSNTRTAVKGNLRAIRSRRDRAVCARELAGWSNPAFLALLVCKSVSNGAPSLGRQDCRVFFATPAAQRVYT